MIAAALLASAPGSMVQAQAAAGSTPAQTLDNYTIQRLVLINDQGQVLLEKNAVGWMTPALRSTKRQSIREALQGLIGDLGVTAGPPRLAGVFTYKFDETPPDPAHAAISFRTHYLARWTGGEVIQPKDPARTFQWVAISRAPALIGMASLRTETLQILEHPETLWGGSFLITFKGGKLVKTEVLEEPYALRPGD